MNEDPCKLVVFVDDHEAVRAANAQTFALSNLDVIPFAEASRALALIDSAFAGMVITDLRMPGMDGLELHRRIAAIDPEIPVVLITGHGDVEDAVSALKAGAYDYIQKPFAPDRLLACVDRALKARTLVLDNRRLRAAALAPTPDIPILGETPVMQRLRELILQIADIDVDVLIEGEPGVGKEFVATSIHRASRRKRKPFHVVECMAIPDAHVGMELLGEASHTSAGFRHKVGRFEAAHEGTLFLHDIDGASSTLQAGLARIVSERAITPAGAKQSRAVSLRIVSAARSDMRSLVASGAFRGDLYYSLAKVRLRIPPLRERRSDIPLTFAAFLADAARAHNRDIPVLTDQVRRRLIDHDWPGNLAELRQFAELVVLGVESTSPSSGSIDPSLPERVGEFEAGVIRDVLTACRGDVRSAIEHLKIPRKTFYDKLRRYGIEIETYRG